jgi:hypothetical protein
MVMFRDLAGSRVISAPMGIGLAIVLLPCSERVGGEKPYKLELAYTDRRRTIDRVTLTWVRRVPLEFAILVCSRSAAVGFRHKSSASRC